ncbi:MAG: preprotein translocase subunit SecG [Holosporaceae bacterium]|jgi:preprotein translocase subunit SecG|nr:preprotein translocase subunit SecG [Holosporaceae bacterium]
MLSFFLAIHFVLAISIIGLVLLQKHDSDGALGSSGGGGAASGMFSVRGQANLLTRMTAILMAIFIINCLVLAKLAKRAPPKESIIDQVAHESVPVDKNTLGSLPQGKVVPSSSTQNTKGSAPNEKKSN